MDLSFLILTLIAAVLVGYILGKGSMRVTPPPPVVAITSSSSSSSRRSKSRSKSPVPERSVVVPEDDAAAQPASPTAAEVAPIAATPPPAELPATRSRRSSSVSSADDDDDSKSSRSGKRVVIVAKQLPLLTRRNPATGKFTKEDPETGVASLENFVWEDNRSFLSGLRALRDDGFHVTWVGVPNTGGGFVSRDEQETYEELLAEHDCVPVYLTPDLSEKFFNGFSKGVLWPMLHYVLPQSNQQFSAQWDDLWQAYNAANAAFSTVISRCVESPTDTIWVHNYHLLLLPSLLRRKLPRAKIGLFIHTPFPSSDVFRVLPTRHNILSSIMAADLIGFHTFDYARHFLSCIKRVMDLDFSTLPGGSLGIKYSGRFVSILISHVGIDSAMFLETRGDAATALQPGGTIGEGTVAHEVAAIRAKYAPRRIVISAGDLDAVKGGLLKFQAYARFFEQYPQWADKVTFVEMLLPNRSVRMDHITDLKELLDAQVDLIHKAHGKDCLHVMQLQEVLPLQSAVAHYAAADVAIFSGGWDGLNLNPFEYTASQADPTNPGALIISEFMGCSRTLSGVVRVNPWNLDDVASAVNAALTMSQAERVANHRRRYKYVMSHTIARWARGFLQHLDRATKHSEGMSYVQVGWGSNVKLMGVRSDFTHLDEETVTAAYRRAERRVLLLDYDGTLTPADKTAHKSRLMGPSKQVKKLLHSLTRDPDNVVFIMSGRTRSTLTEWFPSSEFPELGLAAEKGLYLRFPKRLTFLCRQDIRRDPSLKRRIEAARASAASSPHPGASLTSAARSQAYVVQTQADVDSDSESKDTVDAHLLVEAEAVPVDECEWECMIALDDLSWKQMALDIIRGYTEQTDGSWIEDKEAAIVWHYEQADPEYGRMQASELQKYIIKILSNPNVDVVRYDYNRILEVKPHGVSKGLAATAILEELFQMHNEKLKRDSRPPSPTGLSGIDEAHESAGSGGMGRHKDSSIGGTSSPSGISPSHARALSNSVFQPTGGGSTLPPFLFCVGDDRSDEDMFVSVQNRDYLEGKLRGPGTHHFASTNHSDSLKRSLSQSGHGHKAAKERAAVTQARVAGDIDEKVARERRKAYITDPFTFTVCVGMKPSNAHYYLHDDEEVVRLLSALGVSSVRMAQTRAADNQALASGSPGGTNMRTLNATDSSSRASGAFHLRPADIPTSPPISTSLSSNYELHQAALALQRQHQSQLASRSPHAAYASALSSQQSRSLAASSSRPRAASHSASEEEDEGDSEDPSASDSEEDAHLARQKQKHQSMMRSSMPQQQAQGLRRAV